MIFQSERPLRALCAGGLAGMTYCHAMDVGMKFDEHVYYMAGLFCCNIALSVALIPMVLWADRFAPPMRLGIWLAAASLAALTVAGFLWSRTLGFPQMADHVGEWDALGLTSVAFEVLVFSISARSVVRMAHAAPRGMVAATGSGRA